MGSKAMVFLGLFLAIALLISSEVTARDLAETTTTSTTPTTADQQTNGIDDAKYHHGGDGYHHGGGSYHHGGGGYHHGGGYGGGHGRGGYNEEGN
ncbi:hypothetical protein RHMOL_Rhmol03G0048900 [Rhododendron molle]|uniref:Uncharacterized protein n=1 Tax=Rhododendron molle TaxID=49168 RepID=A0ACC0PB17_RHOML|nr:hypothetical protein RHMOL_Rhmol03G0048900 [Rhododendron molle]